MSHAIALPAPIRAATALTALLSYLAGLGCWGFAWWANYLPSTQFSMSSGKTFGLFVVGLCLQGFAQQLCHRAGRTAWQMPTVLFGGAFGLAVWAAALFHPATWFPGPLSSGLQFAAFLMGCASLGEAGLAARTMSGLPED